MFRGIIAVCYERGKHEKHIYLVGWKNLEYFNVEASGTHSNHCVTNGYIPVMESTKYKILNYDWCKYMTLGKQDLKLSVIQQIQSVSLEPQRGPTSASRKVQE
jgi:hypothetical protein